QRGGVLLRGHRAAGGARPPCRQPRRAPDDRRRRVAGLRRPPRRGPHAPPPPRPARLPGRGPRPPARRRRPALVALQSYGVLKATILDRRHATAREAHYHVLCGIGTTRRRVAINSWSDVAPSEVAQAVIEDFEHPILARLARLNDGWHRLTGQDGLDYIRGGLCRPEQF